MMPDSRRLSDGELGALHVLQSPLRRTEHLHVSAPKLVRSSVNSQCLASFAKEMQNKALVVSSVYWYVRVLSRGAC